MIVLAGTSFVLCLTDQHLFHLLAGRARLRHDLTPNIENKNAVREIDGDPPDVRGKKSFRLGSI